jgi:hypothetical protein
MNARIAAWIFVAAAVAACGADLTLTTNITAPGALNGGAFTPSGSGTPASPYFYDFSSGPGAAYSGLNLSTAQVRTVNVSLTNASLKFDLNGGAITATSGDLTTENTTVGTLAAPSLAGAITITNAGNITLDSILARGTGGNYRKGAAITITHDGSLLANLLSSAGTRQDAGNIFISGDEAGTGPSGRFLVTNLVANNAGTGGDAGRGGMITVSGYTNILVVGTVDATKRVLNSDPNDVTLVSLGSIQVGGAISTLNFSVSGGRGGDLRLTASNGVSGSISVSNLNTSARDRGGDVYLYADTSIRVGTVTNSVSLDSTSSGNFTATHDGSFAGASFYLVGDRAGSGRLVLDGDARRDGASGSAVLGAIEARNTDASIAGGNGAVGISGYTNVVISGLVNLGSTLAGDTQGVFSVSANGAIQVSDVLVGLTNGRGGKVTLQGRDSVTAGALVGGTNAFMSLNANAITVANFAGSNDTISARVRQGFSLTDATDSEARRLFLSASNAATAFAGMNASVSTVYLDLPSLASVTVQGADLVFRSSDGAGSNPGVLYQVLFGSREEHVGGSDYTNATVVGTFTNIGAAFADHVLGIDAITLALGHSWTTGWFGLRSVNTNWFDLDGDGLASEQFSSLAAINVADSSAFMVVLSSIPEPAPLALLLFAGLAAAWARRRWVA